jgi:uncharacterized protein YbbK (DUF523 family)
MIFVSACLTGERCRYDGKSTPDENMIKMVKNGKAVAACPEVMAGAKTPRIPAEIIGGDGFDVLDGKAKIFDKEGNDKTEEFLKGANLTLELCKKESVSKAILKARSPSCGSGIIYDGSFKGRLKGGFGVAAALLSRSGVEVTGL